MSPIILSLSLLSLSQLAIAPAQAGNTDGVATWDPSPEQETVYRALLVRHDPPSCEQLDAMTETPVETYLYLVQNAQQPAWVSMRAASCLIHSHTSEALPQLEQWVVDPDTRGLAILLVGQLDELPLDVATNLATKALTEGPDPEGMARRLRRLETPELQALADMPVVTPAETTVEGGE